MHGALSQMQMAANGMSTSACSPGSIEVVAKHQPAQLLLKALKGAYLQQMAAQSVTERDAAAQAACKVQVP